MRKYKARIADKILEKRLLGKGAVLIEGAKWCGKTTTAEQIARSILYMADPEKEKQSDRDTQTARHIEPITPERTHMGSDGNDGIIIQYAYQTG